MKNSVVSYVLISWFLYAPPGTVRVRGLPMESKFLDLLVTHVNSNGTFVDKTPLIRELLLNASDKVVITRPRRWGKSTNMDMLRAFLSVDTSDRHKSMFSTGEYVNEVGVRIKFPKLKISEYPDAMAHRGVHPTLYVDLSRINITQYTVEQFRKALATYVRDIFSDYPYLEGYGDEDDSLTKIEKRRLNRFARGELNDDDARHTISLLAKVLYRYFNNTPVYVLVDEYDSCVNDFFFAGGPTKMFRGVVKIFKNMFNAAFNDTESYIGKVLMTGTLPFLRDDARMDDFEFYTVQEARFSEYYGVTEHELDEFLEREQTFTPEQREKIKAYYNGYVNDEGKIIYNVWSIVNCLFKDGVVGDYWSNSNPILDKYTKKAILSEKIIRNYRDLINFKAIERCDDSEPVKYDNISEEFGALHLLLHKGYLTLDIGNDSLVRYRIPNSDIRSAYVAEHARRLQQKKLSSPARPQNRSLYFKVYFETSTHRWFSVNGTKNDYERGTEDESASEDRSLRNEDGTPFNKTEVIDKLVTDFNTVFRERIGKVSNFKATLRIRANATPKFVEPRPASKHVLQLMAEELATMESNGIITKVNTSEWATPLVPLVQNGKKLRICGDYKVTINPDLIDEDYQIPMIHDIFHKMKHGKFFCTLDVYKAYLHVEVDNKTADIQTINTHNGLYRMNRMMFGSKNAPKIFQRLMDTILDGLEGTAAFFDDVIVQGRNVGETTRRLRAVLERLQRYDMHLNLKKCKFFEKSVKYLGHRIDDKGKHKLQDKVDAILKAPRPRSVTELKSFLGLIHYYGKFVNNLSTVLYSLNKLLHKNTTYQWSESCERSFVSVKNSIADQSFLVPYDPNLPLVLATDASPHAIGAVLSHIRNGEERPIEFASKSLTKSEMNYSEVDKKAAAMYWALKKFHQFCCDRKFTLITDREPLEAILKADNRRMKRFAQYLSGFTFEVRYRNATDHANTDFLARFPVQDDDSGDTSGHSGESRSEELQNTTVTRNDDA